MNAINYIQKLVREEIDEMSMEVRLWRYGTTDTYTCAIMEYLEKTQPTTEQR